MLNKLNEPAQEHGAIRYGEQLIRYQIVRRIKDSNAPRKVLIKVHPDQRVVATVPNEATGDSIQTAMLKRARWIWKNIHDFALKQAHVMPRQYVSGEAQFYLGKRYVLKRVIDAGQKPSVKLKSGFLMVTLKQTADNNQLKVKKLLDSWYGEKAKTVFAERLKALTPKLNWVVGTPAFQIMIMKKQWGSCSAKGTLMLNPHLVKAGKDCIDYVILHELCHIEEHNHSEKFWRLLTQVMPNWEEVKSKLDDMAEMYLNE